MPSLENIASRHDGAKCHAAAGHDAATARGAFGELCDACWARVRALIAKISGRLPLYTWHDAAAGILPDGTRDFEPVCQTEPLWTDPMCPPFPRLAKERRR